MVSADEEDHNYRVGEIQEEPETSTGRRKLMDFIPIYIPTVQEGLLEEVPRERRFLDFLKARPPRDWFLHFGFRHSPNRRSPSEENGPYGPAEPQTPATAPTRDHHRFRVPFVRKAKWGAMIGSFKEWAKNPIHMVILAWLGAVFACLFVMGLIMTGLLDDAIPESSRRRDWLEVVNQILNALFTIGCLYEHPKLFHHLVLVLRWKAKDAAEARRAYSKKGVPRPHERAHIGFVVVLLHLTCLSQYALCALYWAYDRHDRPDQGEAICLVVGVVAPVVAGAYTVVGPLGRKVEAATDEESQRQAAAPADTRQAESVAERVRNRRVVVSRPEWVGGLFDCWDDMTVAYLSFFCTFCVFGWNMERLGFGNMYVHIITFVLVIIAPFWVFYVSALNIDDDVVQQAVGITGVVLCVFGLLYGGFWRIQMRKKFKLPSNHRCCGSANMTDCLQWQLCWACSLAQEVRTANFYDTDGDGFYAKGSPSSFSEEEGGGRPVLRSHSMLDGSTSLLPMEPESAIRSNSCPPKLDAAVMGAPGGSAKVADTYAGLAKGDAAVGQNSVVIMAPPVPPSIWRVEYDQRKHSGQS